MELCEMRMARRPIIATYNQTRRLVIIGRQQQAVQGGGRESLGFRALERIKVSKYKPRLVSKRQSCKDSIRTIVTIPISVFADRTAAEPGKTRMISNSSW